jgi:hypothetical protein
VVLVAQIAQHHSLRRSVCRFLFELIELGYSWTVPSVAARTRRCWPIPSTRCWLTSLSGVRERGLPGLTEVVPSVADWRGASLPQALDPECVRRFGEPRWSTAAGLRDFAILLTLARLRLGAREIAAIQLGDVDWRPSR